MTLPRGSVSRLLPKAEVIGPPECPLFTRWTLLAPRNLFKLRVHHFAPERQDGDCPHDHPWWFLTFVVKGGYDDLVTCKDCDGEKVEWLLVGAGDDSDWVEVRCRRCRGRGIILSDRVNAPTVRFRRADYQHMTRTDERGAWTVVITGPVARDWGFWRDGHWWPFRLFEDTFGFTWRCEEPDRSIR